MTDGEITEAEVDEGMTTGEPGPEDVPEEPTEEDAGMDDDPPGGEG